jgi:rubrerythrin
MNVFEFAMKMEKDGQEYYEQQAAKSDNTALKRIWQQMAADEVKHYEIFRRFRDGEVKEAAQMAKAGTQILATVKSVFEELSAKKEDLRFGDDILAAWNKAQQVEVETEKFYRQKEKEESDPEVKNAFRLIADEEAKHAHLIEHVLNFLHQPKSWLEDAEWSNINAE